MFLQTSTYDIDNNLVKDLFFVEAEGLSMRPFLKSGDKLVVKKATLKNLHLGDVIVYQRKDSDKVCHRLVRKKMIPEGLILFVSADTSGYSGNAEIVSEDMLYGKVIAICRDGRMQNLDSLGIRLFNRLIVYFSPCFWLIKNMIIYFLNIAQNIKAYREILHFLIYKKFSFTMVDSQDKYEKLKVFEQIIFHYAIDDQIKLAPSDSNYMYVALYKNKIVGRVHLHKKESESGSEWWISGLYVRLRFRGAGVGKKLVTDILDYAKNKRIDKIYTSVWKKAHAAYLIYENLGFEEIGQKIINCNDWLRPRRYLLMEKVLN